MKKGEVRKLIYSLIKPLIEDRGFRSNKGDFGGFVRAIPGGSQYLGVPLVDHNPTFKFSLIVAIRLEAVEEIANKFNAAPPKYHPDTHTFSSRLERFMPGQDTQFVVVTEEDIKAVVARLKPVVLDRIIPFLDETQNLQGIAKAMNVTEIPKVISGTGGGMRALTVARLIGHPDFDVIATGYQQRFSQLPKQFQDEFQNFVQYVKKLDLKTPV